MVRLGAVLLVLVFARASAGVQAPAPAVVLSTTTSTQDSGLLDVLVPLFEQQSGLTLKSVPVGTGQALALAARGEGDRALFNVYSVMEVNPANGPRVNAAGGKAFADFMVAPATQAVIKTFGVEKFGQPLFVPIAGKHDEDL